MKKTVLAGIVALLALTSTTGLARPSELPKVEDPTAIQIAYNNKGNGKVSAVDKKGLIQQFMEIWENGSQAPNVVTYMIVGTDRTAFSVTWGRGPINRAAFKCDGGNIPEFGEKSLWVATVKNGLLSFQEIQDDSVKGLFDNLTKARRDWSREVNSGYQRSKQNLTEKNIMIFIKEKNREKWLEQGWLQPATTCVQHFR